MPLPKVKGVSEAEVFKVVKSGKTKRKCRVCTVLCNAIVVVNELRGSRVFVSLTELAFSCLLLTNCAFRQL